MMLAILGVLAVLVFALLVVFVVVEVRDIDAESGDRA